MVAPAVAGAHANLERGSAFLARQRCDLPGRGQRRVVANGLRELDRMLNLLIEAVAAAHAERIDATAFARQRNAARKLHRLAATIPLPSIDGERLSAVGRVRACLFHCDGIPHSAATAIDLRAATGCEAAFRDGKLALTAAGLSAICTFYDGIAAGLLVAATAPSG